MKKYNIFRIVIALMLYGFTNITLAIGLYDAAQSTVYSGGGEAARAIDGNTSGVWSDNSVTHTQSGDTDIWWQATLYDHAAEKISVSIYNRTDCCSDRIDDVYVTLLDDTGVVLAVQKIDYVAGQSVYTLTMQGMQPGDAQFIKITKASGILSLAEVVITDVSDDVAHGVNPPYGLNLLENSNAQRADLSGWTITENGGNGWRAEPVTQRRNTGFSTSYQWNKKEQVVNLLENGFTAEILDKQPTILFSEIFAKRWCPDYYFLDIELLDADMNVMHSWSSGERQHSGSSCDDIPHKDQITSRLTHYGTGLRYIRWRDGGKDSEFWQGNFGARMEDAVLMILPVNLLDNPDVLSSWTLLSNDGDGVKVTSGAEGSTFSTSYGWTKRQQTIDLIAQGYTEQQLDAGYPIIASGRYGKVACPDWFYLNIDLLDANQQVITSWSSGEIKHQGECDFTYQQYEESITRVFSDYGAGVRYIRWEDGGRDSEVWAGHFGAALKSPYLAIANVDEAYHGYLSRYRIAPDSGAQLMNAAGLNNFFDVLVVGLEVGVVTALGCNPIAISASSGATCVAAVAVDAAIIGSAVILTTEDNPTHTQVDDSAPTTYDSRWCNFAAP